MHHEACVLVTAGSWRVLAGHLVSGYTPWPNLFHFQISSLCCLILCLMLPNPESIWLNFPGNKGGRAGTIWRSWLLGCEESLTPLWAPGLIVAQTAAWGFSVLRLPRALWGLASVHFSSISPCADTSVLWNFCSVWVNNPPSILFS